MNSNPGQHQFSSLNCISSVMLFFSFTFNLALTDNVFWSMKRQKLLPKVMVCYKAALVQQLRAFLLCNKASAIFSHCSRTTSIQNANLNVIYYWWGKNAFVSIKIKNHISLNVLKTRVLRRLQCDLSWLRQNVCIAIDYIKLLEWSFLRCVLWKGIGVNRR